MKILYCAIDQTVPGTKGGSIHVEAVARGLAALGHEVHVLVSPGHGGFPGGGAHWMSMSPPLGAKELRWMRTAAVTRIARRIRPDVVIERYYNFGGEGIAAAHAVGALAVLEVNAPVIDHPGSTKARVDKALLIEPMRRWRDRLCARAHLVVTPSRSILPPAVEPFRIVEIEWGADTDRFRPQASGPLRFTRPPGTLAVFAGAFRSWHGAIHLVRAIRLLRERGRTDISAVLIGDGPELPRARAEAARADGILFTGAIPHADVPAQLAAADIGVAPFDTAAHEPLSLGFYWSPLKLFEYMATGLPVAAPAVDRIPTLVAHETEGILYDTADRTGLAAALERLSDPALRTRLGAAARARALAEYSWAAHCRKLEEAFGAALSRLRAANALHSTNQSGAGEDRD
ncbi:MAG: glycosyltransferase family 4 protein, partial [Burkholderiales bacterium]